MILSDDQFSEIYQTEGPTALSRILGIAPRRVYDRRAEIEARTGQTIVASAVKNLDPIDFGEDERHEIALTDGIVLVGGDGHYWPGKPSTAHRAFVAMCKELKPKVVVFNGDALDGATISRHPPIGWEKRPSLEQELEVVQERLGEIALAAKKAKKYWPLGNHDARFNTRLASMVPEFRNIHGTRLVHHFPDWVPCWSAFIGGERGAVIKHRFKGGIHATHNNALWGGRTIVTGHLHSQKVTPFTDYNGTRWGVDCGTLSATKGPQFEYVEDNPLNWRSGFAVLTWRKGQLLTPELVTVWDEKQGLINWRGELIRV